MRVTVEALEDWRYVDAIDRVLEACLAGAAWHPVRDAEAPEHRNSSLSLSLSLYSLSLSLSLSLSN
jgi:hypothetical protein